MYNILLNAHASVHLGIKVPITRSSYKSLCGNKLHNPCVFNIQVWPLASLSCDLIFDLSVDPSLHRLLPVRVAALFVVRADVGVRVGLQITLVVRGVSTGRHSVRELLEINNVQSQYRSCLSLLCLYNFIHGEMSLKLRFKLSKMTKLHSTFN